MVAEPVTVALGAAVMRAACKIWIGRGEVLADASTSAVELLSSRLTSRYEQRSVQRLLDDCGDVVGRHIEALLRQPEFRDVPPNELEAAGRAVTDTLDEANVDGPEVFRADLDAGTLERHLQPYGRPVVTAAGLSEAGRSAYAFLFREACAYVIRTVATLPGFGAAGLAELLHRQTLLSADLRTALERLPERRGVDDFLTDYRRQTITMLDRMELFGARVDESSRNYPLSVAYLSLQVSWDRRPGALAEAGRVDELLSASSRVLVVGDAGSGKTTLLRWLAVRAAERTLPPRMSAWNDAVPFLVPLRRYAAADLPAPEHFVETVGPMIAAEMPDGWVHRRLRDGRALVLVDGLDELPPERRRHAQQWLRALTAQFPQAHIVVTSRPQALPRGWSWDPEFVRAELNPLSPPDVAEFVRHWHEAVAVAVTDTVEREKLERCRTQLLDALHADRHLRQLASTPLLCALLCALNREYRTELPRSRTEVYEAALEMLLERRDREREVALPDLGLSRTAKTRLLQDVALWMVRNGRSVADADEVVARITLTAPTLELAGGDPGAVPLFRYLLERSGLLREPAVGQVDFVHRTFQEYLAGKGAIAENGIGELVRNAADDQWREVVVMAAGHASARQADALLDQLVRKLRRPPAVLLVALAALRAAPQVSVGVRGRVEQAAAALLPPRGPEEGRQLAAAGDFVLDLMPTAASADQGEGIMALAKARGDDGGLRLIADKVVPVAYLQPDLAPTLLDARRYFDRTAYRQAVLDKVDLSGVRRDVEFSEWVEVADLPRPPRDWLNFRPYDLGLINAVPAVQLRHLRVRIADAPSLAAANGLFERMTALTSVSLAEIPAGIPGLLVHPGVQQVTLMNWRSLATVRALAGLVSLTRLRVVACLDHRFDPMDLSTLPITDVHLEPVAALPVELGSLLALPTVRTVWVGACAAVDVHTDVLRAPVEVVVAEGQVVHGSSGVAVRVTRERRV